jgi:hypothetical protein
MFLSNQLIKLKRSRSTGDDRASSERDFRVPAMSSQPIEIAKVKCEKWQPGSSAARGIPLPG